MSLHIEIEETKKGPRFRVWKSTGGMLDVPTGEEMVFSTNEMTKLIEEASDALGAC